LKAGLASSGARDDRSIARYDRDTGDWRVLELDSPSHAVVGPDGRLYVTNVHHKTISIVDIASFSLLETVRVGDADWGVDGEAIGPDGLSFSPDGSSLVSADYEGLSLTAWDVTANGLENKRVIPMEGVVKAATFSPDGDELWVVIYGLTNDHTRESLRAEAKLESMGDWYHGPQPADERSNAYRTTRLVVLDAKTFDEVVSTETPKALIAPRFARDGSNFVYFTTSAGSVYSIDRASDELKITGEAEVGRVGLPIVCGNLAL
jgi:DNA-binding beta-propeller fold protein YncE